ncbi:MAG: DUF86 domain-containing protein [Candidatus Methanoplasma sp.]|nr:DUF86 domain-containing protein [Candidatus Methanoplasma sp.]
MERFGEDENQYLGDIGYKDACSLCIAQIGELCGRISPMVRTAFPYVEWSRIKGLRNIINHDYGVIDDSMMWFFLHDQVAELRRSCLDIIRTLERTQRYDDPRR